MKSTGEGEADGKWTGSGRGSGSESESVDRFAGVGLLVLSQKAKLNFEATRS